MQDNLYNIAFERSILSSIIYNPASFEELSGFLNSDDYYLTTHRAIFDAMKTLETQNKPIDEEFLKKELIKLNAFDEQVMLEILSANPISNTKAYVEELVDKSRLRKLLNVTNVIKRGVLEENLSSDEVISQTEDELNAIVDMVADDFGIVDINDVEDADTEFVLKAWLPIPRGTATLIAAPGGTGKSWTALQLAIRHYFETNNRCAVWLSEDQEYESKSRGKAICEHILHKPFDLPGVALISRSPIPLIVNKKFSHANFYKFKKNFKDFDLIIYDPLLAFYGGEENDNSQARMFMQPFMDWAKETNKCIIFLHHSKKGGDGSMKINARGAGAFVDAARTVYEINKIDEESQSPEREFVLTKDNYGVIKMLKSFKVRRTVTPKPPLVVEYTNSLKNYGDKIELTVI